MCISQHTCVSEHAAIFQFCTYLQLKSPIPTKAVYTDRMLCRLLASASTKTFIPDPEIYLQHLVLSYKFYDECKCAPLGLAVAAPLSLATAMELCSGPVRLRVRSDTLPLLGGLGLPRKVTTGEFVATGGSCCDQSFMP